jgi:hypothetical protein
MKRRLVLVGALAAFGMLASTTFAEFSAAPPITIEAPSSVTTSDPSGADVTYTAKSHLDPALDITCTPPGTTGTTFTAHLPPGNNTISCSDTAGNTASATVTVTYNAPDTTPPVVSVPNDITEEATSADGAIVTFTATATDTDPPNPTVVCTPASGSMFPIGETTVTCSATDAAGNTGSASFKVTVNEAPPPPPPPPPEDTEGPQFSNVPGTITAEANGPGGSVVSYTTPTATDAVDGPIASVSCSPPSGSTFPLGSTMVTCSASDLHGNTSTASFAVNIVDTTKPTLVVPADRAVYAETPDGISAQSSAVASFLSQAQAVDAVDVHPSVTNDAPGFLTVGVHVVTFVASDASGNSVSKTATLDVRPQPQPEPGTTPPPLPVPPVRTPPRDVTGLKAEAGDAQVRLSWNTPAGVDHVVVTSALSAGGDADVVYTGTAETFTVRNLVNGLEYRFVVVSVDKNGDTSAGVAVTALPKATLLRSPRDGARLKKPPKLLWVKNAEASYYNVQLFRGTTKILSAWPKAASLALKRTWKYSGRKYTLTPGVYRWYVWPGFGARANADYGEMLGFSNFQILR